jgi:hypothetical protein
LPGYNGVAGCWLAGQYYPEDFLGFVRLAAICILLKAIFRF